MSTNRTTKGKARTVRHGVGLNFTPPAAHQVCIAGSFNDRHPGVTPMVSLGGGQWRKELTLPPGRYEYRLVVDGQWMADPNATESVPNPFGGQNSVLAVG